MARLRVACRPSPDDEPLGRASDGGLGKRNPGDPEGGGGPQEGATPQLGVVPEDAEGLRLQRNLPPARARAAGPRRRATTGRRSVRAAPCVGERPGAAGVPGRGLGWRRPEARPPAGGGRRHEEGLRHAACGLERLGRASAPVPPGLGWAPRTRASASLAVRRVDTPKPFGSGGHGDARRGAPEAAPGGGTRRPEGRGSIPSRDAEEGERALENPPGCSRRLRGTLPPADRLVQPDQGALDRGGRARRRAERLRAQPRSGAASEAGRAGRRTRRGSFRKGRDAAGGCSPRPALPGHPDRGLVVRRGRRAPRGCATSKAAGREEIVVWRGRGGRRRQATLQA